MLQSGQAFLQVCYVRVPVFTPVAAGAALQELHPHLQLAELKVLAFLPKVHAAAHRAILRAEGGGARHPQGVPKREQQRFIQKIANFREDTGDFLTPTDRNLQICFCIAI